MTLYNLVRMYTATTGTADVVVTTAVAGYKDCTDVPNGAAVTYSVFNVSGGLPTDSEIGHGTWNSATLTIARTTVLSSTNGNAKIVLAGSGQVALTVAAEDINAASILAALLTVDGAGSGLDADLLDGQSSAYYATAAADALKVLKAGDDMTGPLNIDVAAGTNLLKLRDGSSNPKLQVQHGTNTVTLDAVSSASEEFTNTGFEIDLTGWTLADVTAGPPTSNLFAWYDFSDISTLKQATGGAAVASDGDPIGWAQDKSGNSRHISQATAGAKPTYKTSIQNGLSVARLDGGDYLSLSSITLPAPYSIYIAMNKTGGGGGWAFDLYSNGPAFIGDYSAGNAEFYGATPRVTMGTINSTIALYELTYDGTTATPYKNGTVGTSGTGTAATVANINHSGTINWIGDQCEILIYSESSGTVARQAVETYLKDKWALW